MAELELPDPGPRADRPSVGWWAIAAGGYAILYVAISSTLDPATRLHLGFEYLGFLPLSGGTATAFLVAAHRSDDPRVRRGFQWYGVSFALTAAGTAIWFVQQSVFGTDPTYSWPNVLYLLSYPSAICGVLAFRAGRLGTAERARLALDTAITLIAAIAVTWLLIVIPMLGTAGDPLERFLSFAYPVGDLLIFAVLVPIVLVWREPVVSSALRWLGIGQMIYLAGDLATQLPNAARWHGVSWPDLVYAAGYVLMIMAVERAHHVRQGTTGPSARALPPSNPLPLTLGLVLYALLLRATLGAAQQTTGALAVAAVLVTVLILTREGVTERLNVRLVQALESEKSDARLKSALGHLRIGIVVQGPDLGIRLANPAAVQMLGLVPRDGTLSGPVDIVREDGTPFPPGTHPASQAVGTGQPVRNVVVGVRRAGQTERTWMLVDVEPRLAPDGRPEEFISSLHDITDRRALEDQLRQAQRMEAVGRLAGGIAHDFNNLLTAILGYSTLVKEGLEPGGRLAEDVEGISSAARRAAALTQQLLAFSRRQQIRPELVDINDVVRDAERLLRRLLGEDILITCTLTPAPLLVRADRGQLDQVIVNLAVNARDALPRGGHLDISTQAVSPDDPECPPELAMAGAAFLVVRDSGLGMLEATRARAFEPFFTTKEVGKGTGLGLSTVYGIVRQSGGDVRIKSAVGTGTTVVICLPSADGAVAGSAHGQSKWGPTPSPQLATLP